MPWEKGALTLGGYVAFFTSDVVFGAAGVGNTHINAEDSLGLDEELTVFRAGAMFRPGPSRRNQLDFSYSGYHRSGSATLSSAITVDGVTYPVGAQVDSLLNFDLIRMSYSYAFVQSERVRLALGLGVYVVPLHSELNVETLGGTTVAEEIRTALPMPALTLRCDVRLFDKLYLDLAVEGMHLSISDYQGSLLDASAAVEYRPWKHFGLGLGYNFTGVHIDGEGTNSHYPGVNFLGEIDIRFNGLFLYGKYLF